MTVRQRRAMLITAMVAGLGVATGLAVLAIGENMLWFFTPSQLLADQPPPGNRIRLGGLVVEGSVRRRPGDLEVRFDLSDRAAAVTVAFRGLLPDLFREGQGIVALGRLDADGVLQAEEVLAKHDETYMPPEIAESIGEAKVAERAAAAERKP
ncbi:MAG: cytochrome c maturation protein CcmE [Immundisolibacterales bacterium]|nr:cytochrome c maturation protein CcmE [Immundisolibacterales bacterium]